MRNQIKEMSEWWDRVLRTQEEENEISDEQNYNAAKVTFSLLHNRPSSAKISWI